MSSTLTSEVMKQIDRAVDVLKAGGIVAFPTDTVYGLGASAFSREAVDRIYEVKERPRNLPLPVLLSDKAQVGRVVASISAVAGLLMECFWPGGLTLVLPCSAEVPSNVTAGSDRVAVRVPDHRVPIAMIEKLGLIPPLETTAVGRSIVPPP